MDALSGTASVLAILKAVYRSTRFVHTFFQSIVDGPSEIRDKHNVIQALQNTLLDLQSLCDTIELGAQQVSRLLANIEQCLADVAAAEKRFREIDRDLASYGIHRTWAKVKWAFERNSSWLEENFARIKLWHTILTFDMIRLNV